MNKSRITKFLSLLLYKIRGKKVFFSEYLTEWDCIKFFFNKGAMPFVRGSIARIGVKKVSGLFFLGKSSRLLHKERLVVGRNCYIGDFSYINCLSKHGVCLGRNVTIREFAWLQLTSDLSNVGESIEIGDGTYIGPRVNLGAAASLVIGKNCQIGAGVSFVAENHQIDSGLEIHQQGVIRKGIVVGDGCWLGNGVVILDGVTIGKGAVIGAGAIVTRDIPENAVAVGNPAKVMRFR